MVTDSPSQSRCPDTARYLTIATEARIIIARQEKIAIPPPSGTVLAENLSSAGFETNPVRSANNLVKCPSIIDNKNEPITETIANIVIG